MQTGTGVMLSTESKAGAGMRAVEEKVAKSLCSLISLKRSRQDAVCLRCSGAHNLETGRRGEGQEEAGERASENMVQSLTV